MRWVEHIKLFSSLQMFFSAITASVFTNRHPSKLGPYLPTDFGRQGCHLFQCLHFNGEENKFIIASFLK